MLIIRSNYIIMIIKIIPILKHVNNYDIENSR